MNWQEAGSEDKHTSVRDGLVQQPEYVRTHSPRISDHLLVWTHTNVMNGIVQQPGYVCSIVEEPAVMSRSELARLCDRCVYKYHKRLHPNTGMCLLPCFRVRKLN